MSDQINSSKGFLKEKMENYHLKPPEKIWDSISGQLGNRNRRGMIILALSAAATIALAVTLGINLWKPHLPEETAIQTREEQIPERIDPDGEVKTPGEPSPNTRESSKPGKERLKQKVVRTVREISEEPEHTAYTEATKPVVGEILEWSQGSVEANQDSIIQEEVIEISPSVSDLTSKQLNDTETDAESDTEVVNLELEGDELTEEPLPDLLTGEDDPRWSVGAAFSPIYSFRDAEGFTMNGSESGNYESGVISYAGGFQVSYRTTSRLAVESGIIFNKMGLAIGAPGIQIFEQSFDFAPLGEEANRSNIVAISNSVGNIVSKSGDIYVNSYKVNEFTALNAENNNMTSELFTDQGIRQYLEYIEFPLNLRYSVIDRDLEVQLVAGMSTNLLIDNYVTMETTEGTQEIGYLTNIRTLNYSGNAGFGLIYHLHSHFSFRIEPRFRYFLNSVNDHTLPSTRPYTIGIYTGINFRF